MAPTCRVPGFPELNYRCEREQVLNDVQNKIRARDARRAGHRPPTRIKFHPPSLLDMLRDEFEEANFFDYHGDPSFWKGIPLTHSVVLTALEEFFRSSEYEELNQLLLSTIKRKGLYPRNGQRRNGAN